MAKRYISGGDTPRLQRSNPSPTHFTKGKGIRKPVKTKQMILKEHKKARAVKTIEKVTDAPVEQRE